MLCRMTPKNAHQKPRVVVLCGPHVQGAQGVNCGRQLAMHGVDVTLFVPNFMKVLDELQTELNLFELTGSSKKSFAKGKQIYLFQSQHRSPLFVNEKKLDSLSQNIILNNIDFQTCRKCL